MTDHDINVCLLELFAVVGPLFILMIGACIYENIKHPSTTTVISHDVKATIHTREQVSVRYCVTVCYRIEDCTEDRLREAVIPRINSKIEEWALTDDRDHVLSDAAHSRLRYLLGKYRPLHYVYIELNPTVSIAQHGTWPRPNQLPPYANRPATHSQSHQPQTQIVNQPGYEEVEIDYERLTAKRLAAVKHNILDPTDL